MSDTTTIAQLKKVLGDYNIVPKTHPNVEERPTICYYHLLVPKKSRGKKQKEMFGLFGEPSRVYNITVLGANHKEVTRVKTLLFLAGINISMSLA